MFLEKILSLKIEEISLEEKKNPLEFIKNEIDTNITGRSLVENLKKNGISIIAELKKASPSRGIIREEYFPDTIAESYEKNGASAISVLTEKNFFLGDDMHLTAVRKKVNLPILRKDFIISDYQIYQSKKLGADAVLLIAACLEREEIEKFMQTANSVNLECILEIHNEDDLKKVQGINTDIIGINNRDLKTFEVSLETSYRLKKLLLKDTVVISESGISSAKDIMSLKNNGFNGVLIGEILLKSPSPGEKLKEFIKAVS